MITENSIIFTERRDTLPKEAEPIRMKGPIHDKLNKTGNNKLPITAPILPTIIVRLTAMVLEGNHALQ